MMDKEKTKLEYGAEEPTPVQFQQGEVWMQEFAQQKSELGELEEAVARKKKELNNTRGKLIQWMREFKVQSHHSSWGLFSARNVFNFDYEDEEVCKQELKSRKLEDGTTVWDSLATVTKTKVKSYVKELAEAAMEDGDDDFEFPGVKDAGFHTELAFRAKK